MSPYSPATEVLSVGQFQCAPGAQWFLGMHKISYDLDIPLLDKIQAVVDNQWSVPHDETLLKEVDDIFKAMYVVVKMMR